MKKIILISLFIYSASANSTYETSKKKVMELTLMPIDKASLTTLENELNSLLPLATPVEKSKINNLKKFLFLKYKLSNCLNNTETSFGTRLLQISERFLDQSPCDTVDLNLSQLADVSQPVTALIARDLNKQIIQNARKNTAINLTAFFSHVSYQEKMDKRTPAVRAAYTVCNAGCTVAERKNLLAATNAYEKKLKAGFEPPVPKDSNTIAQSLKSSLRNFNAIPAGNSFDSEEEAAAFRSSLDTAYFGIQQSVLGGLFLANRMQNHGVKPPTSSISKVGKKFIVEMDPLPEEISPSLVAAATNEYVAKMVTYGNESTKKLQQLSPRINPVGAAEDEKEKLKQTMFENPVAAAQMIFNSPATLDFNCSILNQIEQDLQDGSAQWAQIDDAATMLEGVSLKLGLAGLAALGVPPAAFLIETAAGAVGAAAGALRLTRAALTKSTMDSVNTSLLTGQAGVGSAIADSRELNDAYSSNLNAGITNLSIGAVGGAMAARALGREIVGSPAYLQSLSRGTQYAASTGAKGNMITLLGQDAADMLMAQIGALPRRSKEVLDRFQSILQTEGPDAAKRFLEGIQKRLTCVLK